MGSARVHLESASCHLSHQRKCSFSAWLWFGLVCKLPLVELQENKACENLSSYHGPEDEWWQMLSHKMCFWTNSSLSCCRLVCQCQSLRGETSLELSLILSLFDQQTMLLSGELLCPHAVQNKVAQTVWPTHVVKLSQMRHRICANWIHPSSQSNVDSLHRIWKIFTHLLS